MRIRFALPLALAALFATTSANAFVSPRWLEHEQSLRKTILGSWHVVGGRQKASSPVDLDVIVEFDTENVRVSEANSGTVKSARWRYVAQEEDMVTISVEDASGHQHTVDVLVESHDEVTLYVQDDEGDDEEVLRLERSP